MDWLKLLPEILESLPDHPIALVSLVALIIGTLVYKMIPPTTHPTFKIAALVLAIGALVGLSWMVVSIGRDVKREQFEQPVNCNVEVLAALDDHLSSTGSYELAVAMEGKNAFSGSLLRRLPHGSPYAGPFTNWAKLSFTVDLPRRQVLQSALGMQFQLGGSPDRDWLGVAEISADCEGRKFRASIEEMHGYGPGGRRTGILYIGETKHWQILRVAE